MFNKNIDQWDLAPSLRRKIDKMEEFLKWPSITAGFSSFERFIYDIAEAVSRKETKRQIDALQLGCEVSGEDFQLLLDHLGLEIQNGKRIVKKTVKKAAPAKKGKK